MPGWQALNRRLQPCGQLPSIFRPALQTCYTFVSASQALLGVVLPLLLLVRREVVGALQYARRAGIPAADRRLRTYLWLCHPLFVDGRLCA